MDIDRALRAMDSSYRDKVKELVEKYFKTGNSSYAEMAISILEKFDNDSDVRELIRTLKR